MLKMVLLCWGALWLLVALTACVRLDSESSGPVIGVDVTMLDQEPAICDDFPNLPICP